jgi:anti-sigma regulatory factor (Ser/Thr protein kinase)
MKMRDQAKLNRLSGFLLFIRHAATAPDTALSEDNLHKVELAAEEILVNIIQYAYPDGAGEIEIECLPAEGGGLEVSFVDEGNPFDVLAKEDPDTSLPIDERAIGGLGIYLVKRLMDRVSYRRDSGKNVLTIVKNNI